MRVRLVGELSGFVDPEVLRVGMQVQTNRELTFLQGLIRPNARRMPAGTIVRVDKVRPERVGIEAEGDLWTQCSPEALDPITN